MWHLQWHEGFNHMLYGYGSKRGLLEDFLGYCADSIHRSVVVLDGCKPNAGVKVMLDLVCKNMLRCTQRFPSVVEKVCACRVRTRV